MARRVERQNRAFIDYGEATRVQPQNSRSLGSNGCTPNSEEDMTHDVSMIIPERTLGKSDAKFAVYEDGELLGTLEVSKGAIVWFPPGTSYGHKVLWSEFDAIMKQRQRFERR